MVPAPRPHQILLPLELNLKEGKIGLRLIDLREGELVARLQRQNLIVHRAELSLRAVEGNLVSVGSQPIEHLPLLHRFVVVDIDLHDRSGDVGGDTFHFGLHIGVVGRRYLPTRHVEIAPGNQGDGQQRE